MAMEALKKKSIEAQAYAQKFQALQQQRQKEQVLVQKACPAPSEAFPLSRTRITTWYRLRIELRQAPISYLDDPML